MLPITLNVLLALLACDAGQPEAPPEPEVPEKCRNVHLDKLDTDWVAVKGAAANPKHRIRILKDGDGYKAWYIAGMFTRHILKGVKRDTDVQFTEVADAEKKAAVEKGAARLVRLYVEPVIEKCGLKVYTGVLEAGDKENIGPKTTDFVAFPQKEGVSFAYQPPDGPLFLGKAASDKKVADKQLEGEGPDPVHDLGKVAVGVFTDAAADGDASCTFDMDVYFDDLRNEDASPVAAGEAKDGVRHWFYEYDAPYSGNHHFEFHRYKTCGGQRELIAVNAIEAILE